MSNDTGLDLTISDNGMEVIVTGYTPPASTARKLSPEIIRQQLKATGIVLEPDSAALDRVIRMTQTNQNVCGMVIVRGQEPDPGKNGFIEPRGDLHSPVFPGDIFADIVPPQAPMPGKTVTGEEIIPSESDRAIPANPALKGECEITDDNAHIRALGYGLASIAGNKVTHEPLLKISRDRMEVTAPVFAHAFDGRETQPEYLRNALTAKGIKAELCEDEVNTALATIRETGKPVEGVLLCRGRPPVDGEDGRLELVVKTEKSVGAQRDDGTVDFHERDTVHNVKAGSILGRTIRPTRGTPGIDVFGNPIPAREGSPITISAGQNVEVSADGMEFMATIDGVVLMADNTLAVTDILEIAKDVDFATGNIHTENGSVMIGGSVRSGFEVTAAGNITVREAIENAVVQAGGDISVGRGIVMHEEGQYDDTGHVDGSLKAGGNVYAHYAQNAKIEAGGDVVIENDLTNCEVLARGRVVATRGKGKIQGGTIRCGRGVEANEIGSDLGVMTAIIIGLESEKHTGLSKEQEKLEAMIHKIDLVLGTGDAREILVRTPKPKRQAVAKLLKARIGARERLAEIDVIFAEERKQRKEQARARVKVVRAIHPGVKLEIAGCQYEVEHALSACQFYFDSKEDKIQIAPL